MKAFTGGLVLLMFCWAMPVFGQVDVYEFETTEQEQRFRQLSNEFRCPMCQNANLTGSPGGVAADLRREIYRMIMEGQTDRQIEQFMLERYGDFVLYRPRLTLQTVLLWFGPLLFLLAGIWFVINFVRRGGDASEDKTVSLTSEEQARLDRLLGKNGGKTTDTPPRTSSGPGGKA
jgi:cytochrome c-type biogenesis protein CcmH